MSQTLKLPFNNVQLELLKLFSENVSNEDLLEFKKMLVKWRFEKMKIAANKAFEQNNWTEKDMEKLLYEDVRKPYKAQNEFLKNRPTN